MAVDPKSARAGCACRIRCSCCADGCFRGHARSRHFGGSLHGDVGDVPARCRTSNSSGDRGRRTGTGPPGACTACIRTADHRDKSANSAMQGCLGQPAAGNQAGTRSLRRHRIALSFESVHQSLRTMATARQSTGLQVPAAVPGSAADSREKGSSCTSPLSRRRVSRRASSADNGIGARAVM